MPIDDLLAIDKLTGKEGIFPSRSELIRCAVREYLIKEMATIEAFQKLQRSDETQRDLQEYSSIHEKSNIFQSSQLWFLNKNTNLVDMRLESFQAALFKLFHKNSQNFIYVSRFHKNYCNKGTYCVVNIAHFRNCFKVQMIISFNDLATKKRSWIL